MISEAGEPQHEQHTFVVSDADGNKDEAIVSTDKDGSFTAKFLGETGTSKNSPEEAVELALNKLATKDQIWIVNYKLF